ncbi:MULTISPECIES: hypothetical protein [Vibrio]|jgi:hypothetical protein|uniref:hypothetical protein n=1 Tax=Vibrio TaxID=662 RepID=UPI000BFFB895|nr:hypothetical protein [Vibrio sp. PID17_43]PHJ40497.1 hypothetical protein AK965_16705 [Vibrio sp. PID17_43]
MERILTSAMEIKKRTQVTSLFASNGFKIVMTDFDRMTFERANTKVNIRYDLSSNVESIHILQK